MAVMCGLDKSSYLCTKFLPGSKSSCKNKDKFCMYARLKDVKNKKKDSVIVYNTNPKINDQLNIIKKMESSFNLEEFLSGAKNAFEYIINTYVKNDEKELEKFLSKNILNIDNNLVEGDPNQILDIKEVWVFSRKLGGKSPIWTLEEISDV